VKKISLIILSLVLINTNLFGNITYKNIGNKTRAYFYNGTKVATVKKINWSGYSYEMKCVDWKKLKNSGSTIYKKSLLFINLSILENCELDPF